ncbi:MAG: Stp1/IreP family PP2C-type Ser/Thr phosphatase [Lachnospiraceae bacterium]|nr:Stp1/IreP family PP2C-type Ser/Thr phosphatase [Lachnospiraceae bacterium]
MKSVALTDVGKKRKLNQDFVFVTEDNLGNLPNVFIVADGMGGHNAGDFASKCTVERIIDEITRSFEKNPIKILDKAIQAANEEVRKLAGEDQDLFGMGTTIVAATCMGKYLQIANVGDSRLYLANVKRRTIRQITRDHSLVEEMVRLGGMDKELAKNHPDKHIITRAIGARDMVNVDFFYEELAPGDMVLMCSDGLSNMLEDEEIGRILYDAADLTEKAQTLVDRANDNGGKDNIAVIIIDPFA